MKLYRLVSSHALNTKTKPVSLIEVNLKNSKPTKIIGSRSEVDRIIGYYAASGILLDKVSTTKSIGFSLPLTALDSIQFYFTESALDRHHVKFKKNAVLGSSLIHVNYYIQDKDPDSYSYSLRYLLV